MDILKIAGDFVVNQVYGIAAGAIVTTFALPVAKGGIISIFKMAETPFSAWVISLVGGEKELAAFIVSYVEKKMPDAIGKEKKAEAARVITKHLPFLPESFVSELIELCVKQMNESLKNSEKLIKKSS